MRHGTRHADTFRKVFGFGEKEEISERGVEMRTYTSLPPVIFFDFVKIPAEKRSFI
jgi:hypothetical protein